MSDDNELPEPIKLTAEQLPDGGFSLEGATWNSVRAELRREIEQAGGWHQPGSPSTLDLAIRVRNQAPELRRESVALYRDASGDPRLTGMQELRGGINRIVAPRDVSVGEVLFVDSVTGSRAIVLRTAKAGEHVDVELRGTPRINLNDWADLPPTIYGHEVRVVVAHRLLFQLYNDANDASWVRVATSGARWVLRVNGAHISDSTVKELCRLAFTVDCELRRVGVKELEAYIYWWALCDRIKQLDEQCARDAAAQLEALLLAAQVETCHAEEYSVDASAHAGKAQTNPGAGFIYSPVGCLSPATMFGGADYAWCRINNVMMHSDTGKPQPGHERVPLTPHLDGNKVTLVWQQEASDEQAPATQRAL